MRERNLNDAEQGSATYRNQLLTIGDLEHFKKDLFEKITELLKGGSGQTSKEWLRSSEVRKLLGISHGTLQNLRINGTLSYTKVGGILYYKQEDIVRLLEGGNSKRK
jgi:hypothetical protein